jgi:hypothetical protein
LCWCVDFYLGKSRVLCFCVALFAGDKPWETEKVMLGSWARGEMYIKDIIEVRFKGDFLMWFERDFP